MSTLELLIVGPERPDTGGIARYVAEQRERLPGDIAVRVHDNGTKSAVGLAGVLAVLVGTLRGLLTFPLRSRPDLVHVHSSHGVAFYRAAPYVLFARYVWDRPVLLHVHGSSFDEFARTDRALVRSLQAVVFDASDTIVVLSEYWKEVLAERVPEAKLAVLPNAVDDAEYDPVFERTPPTVTFVSNHVERKGIVEFVEAIDRLCDESDRTFRVRIAGSGPKSSLAADLARRHENVEYLGYVSEAEKRRLLDESSAYVLPTYAEGLPIALLEGMAGGNAVVTTGVGSIPEVVGEENGRLVDPGSADALARALADLLDAPDQVTEMGRTNHELVQERYSWLVVVDRLVDVYRDTLSAEPST